MNVAMAITAIRYGAACANYVEVVEIIKKVDDVTGQEVVCGAKVRDRITSAEWDIKAKVVVNATGPYTDSIRLMANENVRKICSPSMGVHVVLPDYYR
jgi:glycerol-3-phosphate dehydrogenase